MDTSPEFEALLEEARPRAVSAPPARELRCELAAGALLVAACTAALVLLPGGGWWHPAVVAALVVAYAAVGRVRFEVGAGYTTATQLVLIPLLFAVPPAAIPLFVALGALLRRLPDVVAGRVHPSRLIVTVPDAWYAAGPAVVLAVAGIGQPTVGDWPILAAAFAAQVGVDLGSSVVREWLVLGVKPSLQVRVFGTVAAVDAALAPIGVLVAITMVSAPAAIICVLPLSILLGRLAREREERISRDLELSSAYRGTAQLMSDFLEADDAYTGGEHTDGVVELALAVGRELELDARRLRDLEMGALLHDVGKLLVSKEIINKPGRLTEEEWAIVQRHPIDGQQMLDRVGGRLSVVGKIVRGHHERLDGTGYPDGLRGEEIPLEARIISACDAYDAMTTTRSYRKAVPEADAMAEMIRCAGSQFDVNVVAALVRVVQRRPGSLAARRAVIAA